MLTNSSSRHQTIEKGLSRISKLTFNKVFSDWRRDIELCSIAKAIQALASSKKSPSKPADLSSVNTSQEVPAPVQVHPVPTQSMQNYAAASQAN